MKKVLVTGASGLLGRSVVREFREAGDWTTLGLAFSRATGQLKQVDLTDKQAVTDVVNDFKPSIIVHCAAERKPDVVENNPEATKHINIDATRFLCEAAAAVDAWLLYISTDYVFDGTKPPYKVSDEPNPLNKYGQSKWDGERLVLQMRDNGVLRVPILYSEVTHLAESAVTVLFEKVVDVTRTCVMSDYERRYPTYAGDVANVIRGLTDKRLQDKSINGIYHWSGDENMTKYDMAVAMATAFRIPTNHIEADRKPTTGTTRPYDSHLDCSRVEQLGIGRRTKFNDSIKSVLDPFSPDRIDL